VKPFMYRQTEESNIESDLKVKRLKVRTLAITLLTWVRLKNNST